MYNVCTTYVQRLYNVEHYVEHYFEDYVEHYFEQVTYKITSWKLQRHKDDPIKGVVSRATQLLPKYGIICQNY